MGLCCGLCRGWDGVSSIALLFLTKHADGRAAGVSTDDIPPNCGFLRKDRVRDDQDPSSPLAGLSAKQLGVLRMMALGYNNDYIARARGAGISTVERWVIQIFRALEIDTHADLNPRVEAVRRFIAAIFTRTAALAWVLYAVAEITTPPYLQRVLGVFFQLFLTLLLTALVVTAQREHARDLASLAQVRSGIEQTMTRVLGQVEERNEDVLGRVSHTLDEELAATDWYSTLATFAGAADKVLTDRPMDSIDASDFLLGKSKETGREHVMLAGADGEIMSVKYGNVKVIFRYCEGVDKPISTPLFPIVYDQHGPEHVHGDKSEAWEHHNTP